MFASALEFYRCSCLLFFGGIEEKTFKAIGACCKALITKYCIQMKSKVSATSCLFLCITVSLSMLCISLWHTSQGLTTYVESIKIKLEEEGQKGKLSSGASKPDELEAISPNAENSEDAFSSSWHEVRKHRTRLLTRTKCLQSLFLVILVSSSAVAHKNRMAIRHTWGTDNALHRKWKTVFLIGEGNSAAVSDRISREAQIFGDIIQGDYNETFANKVFKIQSGFEWAATYCDFKYLLKTDDDVFVNTRSLVSFLSGEGAPKTEFYFGNLMHGSPVLRSGFYAVSKEDHPEDVFKDYLSGGGYVVSKDLVIKFTQMFDVVKPLKIDDAYIGKLAADIGVKPISTRSFFMYHSKSTCVYDDNYFLVRPVDHQCMVKFYDENQKIMLSQPMADM